MQNRQFKEALRSLEALTLGRRGVAVEIPGSTPVRVKLEPAKQPNKRLGSWLNTKKKLKRPFVKFTWNNRLGVLQNATVRPVLENETKGGHVSVRVPEMFHWCLLYLETGHFLNAMVATDQEEGQRYWYDISGRFKDEDLQLFERDIEDVLGEKARTAWSLVCYYNQIVREMVAGYPRTMSMLHLKISDQTGHLEMRHANPRMLSGILLGLGARHTIRKNRNSLVVLGPLRASPKKTNPTP